MSDPVVCIECGATSYNDPGKTPIRCASCWNKLLTRAVTAERELAELKERTRWVPVSERLPEGGQVVIFYDAASKAVRYGWHASGIMQWTAINDLYFHGKQYRWITHWKPKPTPPEAE